MNNLKGEVARIHVGTGFSRSDRNHVQIRDLVLHSALFPPMCGLTSVSRTLLVPLTHKHIVDGFVDGPLALVHYVK